MVYGSLLQRILSGGALQVASLCAGLEPGVLRGVLLSFIAELSPQC